MKANTRTPVPIISQELTWRLEEVKNILEGNPSRLQHINSLLTTLEPLGMDERLDVLADILVIMTRGVLARERPLAAFQERSVVKELQQFWSTLASEKGIKTGNRGKKDKRLARLVERLSGDGETVIWSSDVPPAGPFGEGAYLLTFCLVRLFECILRDPEQTDMDIKAVLPQITCSETSRENRNNTGDGTQAFTELLVELGLVEQSGTCLDGFENDPSKQVKRTWKLVNAERAKQILSEALKVIMNTSDVETIVKKMVPEVTTSTAGKEGGE